MVKDALTAGAIGTAVGRNVWQAENPLEMARKTAELIFGNNFKKKIPRYSF
jgi:DhnA family fructose-bisphosphate aldolase class Ia